MQNRVYGKTLIIILLATIPASSLAQNHQKDINEQVWKPFIKSFNEGNNDGFKAVHSKDVLRVEQDNNKVLDYDQYFPKNPPKWPGKNNIELRFLQRIASEDQAFEVGYYKSTHTSADGKVRIGYGKFHVALRKENGVWKILVDADARADANEQTFAAARALE
jgi:ketosteroid isomerase-like protein